MTIKEARELSAQAWCERENRQKIMDPDLAETFAKILVREVALAKGVCPGCGWKFGYGHAADCPQSKLL